MRQRKFDVLLWFVLLITLGVLGHSIYRLLIAPPRYTLSWQSENSLDVLGFNVYRATEDEEKAYRPINPTLIPAEGLLDSGSYHYTDDQLNRKTTYYYKIETIYRDGRRSLPNSPLTITIP